MKPLYVVPGFAGSELREGNADGSKWWVQPARLLTYGMFHMRLADNGIDPHPKGKLSLIGGRPLPDYYGKLIDRVKEDLEPEGYEVIPWGWDWRKRIAISAERLASDIEANTSVEAPAVLVCHSAGGLVGRRAYWLLTQRGKANLVRRIVTLGTPHRGTYAPIGVFCLTDDTVDQICEMARLSRWVVGRPPSYVQVVVPNEKEFSEIFGTWPGLYDLMPLVDTQGATIDPNVGSAYNAGLYPESHGVKSQWLDAVRLDWQPWLRSQESVPPAHVLTTVAGSGYGTLERVTDALKLGKPEALARTDEGDGTVTIASALVPGVPQWTFPVSHNGLLSDERVLNELKDWVLEVRNPSTPVPPPSNVPGAAAPKVNGPPFPGEVQGFQLNSQGQTFGEAPPAAAGVQPPAAPIASFTGGRDMYHVSIVWQQTDRALAEWTENFWAEVSSIDAALSAGKKLAAAMEPFHGQGANWVRVEARKVRGPDNAEVNKDQDYVSRGFTTQAVADEAFSDQATTSIFIALYGGDDYTQQWIKGVQDRWVDNNGVLKKKSQTLKDAVEAFEKVIKADPWRIRCLDDNVKKKTVSKITETGIVEVATHNFDPIFPVRISGSLTNKYVNQIWEISPLPSPDANKFQLNFFSPPEPWIPPKGKLRARQQRYVFKNITLVKLIHASTHKVGGPKKKYVGSKKKVRS